MSRNKEENFHGATEKHYYLGNKNLPRGTAEFEWTPEMMHHLKKCKRNILFFAENFFYIVNLDRGKEKIALIKGPQLHLPDSEGRLPGDPHHGHNH